MTQPIIMLAGTCGHHHVKDCATCTAANDCTNTEMRRLHAEIGRLRQRLEISDDITERYDGIACRDETIRLLDAKVERLTAETQETDDDWFEDYAEAPSRIFWFAFGVLTAVTIGWLL